MVKSLYNELNGIKKQWIFERDLESRLERLKEICSDDDILNDAIEIAKHESTMLLPGATLITALVALLLNFSVDPTQKYVILVAYVVIILFLTNVHYPSWTRLYYDLIELRRKRREEHYILRLGKLGLEAIKIMLNTDFRRSFNRHN